MRFVVVFFLLFRLSAWAQSSLHSVFSLKPALGGNVCQIHGDSYNGYDKPGLFGGVGLNARFTNRISLELGFYYSQKGARHNPNSKTGDLSSYVLRLNYIDLPLSLRFMLNSRYFTTLGPSVAYLFSYKEEIDYANMTGFYDFRNYEIGLNVGLGRYIGDKFSVEFRCSNSLSTIRPYGQTSTVYYSNPIAQFFNKGLYNNILTLFVTYHIDLNKKS